VEEILGSRAVDRQLAVDCPLVVALEEWRLPRLRSLRLERHANEMSSARRVDKGERPAIGGGILSPPQGIEAALVPAPGLIGGDHLRADLDGPAALRLGLEVNPGG